jgi:PKD repeat protein
MLRRRRAQGALLLVAVSVAALAIPAAAQQTLSITADQGLSPAFSTSIHDYVIRCTGQPVVTSVDAPPGTGVSVDHSAMQSGSFATAVRLSEGQEFSIAVRQNGSTDHFYVRCLPADFPSYTFTEEKPSPYGLFTTDSVGNYLEIFDTNGVPVWWMKRSAGALDSSVLRDGTVGFYDKGVGANEIYTLAGQPVREVRAVNGATDLHELQLLANGDYLIDTYLHRDHVDLSVLGGSSDASVLDGEAEEIAPDGHLVWSWNSGAPGHIAPADTPQSWYDALTPCGTTSNPCDLVHLNSIEPHGSEIVISARHTDAVWGLDKSSGAVRSKLGGTSRPESLTLTGDPLGSYPLRGQHDARFLADGTLTVFDDRTGLSEPPRAVHFGIDEQAHTATYIASLSDPGVTASFCCGSFRRMPDGGALTAWGGGSPVGRYAADGSRMFKLEFASSFSYRAIPVPDSTTISQVRAGMNAQYPRVDTDLPPVARFGASPNPVAVGVPTNIDASSSDDPDGVVVSYDWDFGDGTRGAGQHPSHVYSHPGDYLVRLTVHDDAGSANTVSHTVTVLSGPAIPSALFTAMPSKAPTDTPIGFDATTSHASGGTIISYAWSFGDGKSGVGPLQAHRYRHPGTYQVTLTVTSSSRLTGTMTRPVRITNRKPRARLSLAPTDVRAGESVKFIARAHDPDGRVMSYRWRFGDGGWRRGRRVRHVYGTPGLYKVMLKVTDNNGAVTKRTAMLRVR